MNKKHRKRSNGEGTVYYSDAMNRWVARVTLADGHRKTFYGPLKDNSSVARIGVEERMRPYVGRRLANGTLTLGKAVSDYIDSHAHLAASTIAGYRVAARHVIGDPGDPNVRPPRPARAADPIARTRLIDLDPMDFKQFFARLQPGRAERGESGDTMRKKVRVLLHAVLEEALDLELITRNPITRKMTISVHQPEKAIWTPEEMLRFLKAIKDNRLYALFLLAISSTMGNAELFGLRWSDLNLDHAQLTVSHNLVTVEGRVHGKDPKTVKRRRTIALPAIVVAALRERRKIALAEGTAASPYVFTNRKGNPLRGDSFRTKIWAPLITKAKVPKITPYAMRHCAKALMEYLDVPLEKASRRMGHSTIKTTADVYGHLYDIAGQAVATKLDEFLAELG